MSKETLAKATLLTHQQMSKIRGGCILRCNQNLAPEEFQVDENVFEVPNCNRETAITYCGENLDNVICSGGVGC